MFPGVKAKITKMNGLGIGAREQKQSINKFYQNQQNQQDQEINEVSGKDNALKDRDYICQLQEPDESIQLSTRTSQETPVREKYDALNDRDYMNSLQESVLNQGFLRGETILAGNMRMSEDESSEESGESERSWSTESSGPDEIPPSIHPDFPHSRPVAISPLSLSTEELRRRQGGTATNVSIQDTQLSVLEVSRKDNNYDKSSSNLCWSQVAEDDGPHEANVTTGSEENEPQGITDGGGSILITQQSEVDDSYRQRIEVSLEEKIKRIKLMTEILACRNSNSCSDEEDTPSRSEDEIYSHQKICKNNFSYLVTNVRGFNSKRLVFQNIVKSSDIDVFFISETHMYEGIYPKIEGYTVVGRNRERKNSKGGIAIAVKDEYKEYIVKLGEGTEPNEYIVIKLTCFQPELVLAVYYGNQEGTTKQGTIEQNLIELFSFLNTQLEKGNDLILAGDFNVHVGEAIRNNDPAVSKGGKLLIKLVMELGLDFANNKGVGNTHTHYDRSAGSSRVLDLVITNKAEDHVLCEVDNEKKLTPYRLKRINGVSEPAYTDHLSIIGECEVKMGKGKDPIRTWRLTRPGGRAEYQRITNEKAEEAARVINESPDCTEMADTIAKMLYDAKVESFGLRTTTHTRFEKETDERLLAKRLRDINEAKEQRDAEGKKLNEQVFLTRKKVCKEEEEIVEAMNHYKTGERMEDKDQILESILEYNKEVLEKNESKDDLSKRMKEIKKIAVEEMKKLETEWSEETLTWDEYRKVVAKVHEVNKTCYRDFIWAGEKWQATMYLFFKRIYDEEDIPEEFLKTRLKKLYKKKGSKALMSSYRFIHLKDWAGKMMEKLAMQKCNEAIARGMPEMQIGGTRQSQTIEHILSVYTMAKIECKHRGGMIIQLIDCQKCFDKVLLSDTLFAAGEAGLHGKRMRVMQNLHENTVISLVGDKSGRSAVIKNSTGQGTNWAPASCSLAMGMAIKKQADNFHETKISIGNVKIDPLMYVDDVERLATTAEGAREGGIIFTRSLNELSLEAHPGKSAQVIMGTKKFKDKIREELAKDPVIIQGWELQESQMETYLGVQISGKGVRDSVTQSIKKRIQSAIAKEVQLSKVLEEDMMDKLGWLECVKVLFNSIIIPTLTYGSQAYVYMTNTQKNEMEMGMKEILYRMLQISKYAQYAAVLLEMNMIKLTHIVNQLKIGFVNQLLHEKKSGFCWKILREEEELYPGTGLLAEVRELCEMYNILDVNEYHLEKDYIRENIIHFGRTEVWKETLTNRRIPYNPTQMKRWRPYMSLPKYDSRLYFAYRIGELQFKSDRKGEYGRKFGNTKCFADWCSEEDTLQHVRRCPGYDVRFSKVKVDKDEETRAEFISYLKKLDLERIKKYNLPILHRRSMKEQLK